MLVSMFSDGARLDPWRGRGPAVGSLIWLPGDEGGEGDGGDPGDHGGEGGYSGEGYGVDSDPGDDGGHGSAEGNLISLTCS